MAVIEIIYFQAIDQCRGAMQIDAQLIFTILYTVLLWRFMDKNKILGRRSLSRSKL